MPFAGGLDHRSALFSVLPQRYELLHAILAVRRAGLLHAGLREPGTAHRRRARVAGKALGALMTAAVTGPLTGGKAGSLAGADTPGSGAGNVCALTSAT